MIDYKPASTSVCLVTIKVQVDVHVAPIEVPAWVSQAMERLESVRETASENA